MANTPQAKKRIRRNDHRAEINGNRMSRIRSFVKKVESGDRRRRQDCGRRRAQAAQPELARGVARGVLHKNTASRKMCRLTKRVAGALIRCCAAYTREPSTPEQKRTTPAPQSRRRFRIVTHGTMHPGSRGFPAIRARSFKLS